jgi:hypothetical protein
MAEPLSLGEHNPAAVKPDPSLSTKFVIPPLHPWLVTRDQLVRVLNEASQRSLTLISAPAGFGKTTLLVTLAFLRLARYSRTGSHTSSKSRGRQVEVYYCHRNTPL